MFMTFAENTMGKPYGHKHHHIFRDLCENQFGFQTFTMFHGWWLPGLMIDWGYYITVQTFTLKDAGVFGFFYHGKVTKLGVMEICIKSNFRLFFSKVMSSPSAIYLNVQLVLQSFLVHWATFFSKLWWQLSEELFLHIFDAVITCYMYLLLIILLSVYGMIDEGLFSKFVVKTLPLLINIIFLLIIEFVVRGNWEVIIMVLCLCDMVCQHATFQPFVQSLYPWIAVITYEDIFMVLILWN